MSRRLSRMFGLVLIATIAALPDLADAQRTKRATAADSARVYHVLNRLAFGPRPGDVQRVLDMGVEAWIDEQLKADTALDAAAIKALNGCDLFTEPVATAMERLSGVRTFTSLGANGSMRSISISGGFLGLVTRDSAMRTATGPILEANAQVVACKLARVEATRNQLTEVLNDFWHNHFSAHGNRMPARASIVEFDRLLIRPNVFGQFRELLHGVVHSPWMLNYLDNVVNSADTTRQTLKPYVRPTNIPLGLQVSRGLNENYARELMELHTMGVDGGYTQADVIDVARALTGWTHTRAPIGGVSFISTTGVPAFRFDSTAHDSEAKTILGQQFPAGRGQEEGEDIINMLSKHPSTAKHIARKLAVRFVSDSPPQALVDRAAATFTRTDGNLREVVRSIVTSPEFLNPVNYRTKIKSPHEFVLSMRRALGAEPDTLAEMIDFLILLQQPPYGRVTPEGWPEHGSPWMNAGAIGTRLDIATNVAAGKYPSIDIGKWPEWSRLADKSFEAQLQGVVATILGGHVSTTTRRALAGLRPSGKEPASEEMKAATLRELIGAALASPEFQRR